MAYHVEELLNGAPRSTIGLGADSHRKSPVLNATFRAEEIMIGEEAKWGGLNVMPIITSCPVTGPSPKGKVAFTATEGEAIGRLFYAGL